MDYKESEISAKEILKIFDQLPVAYGVIETNDPIFSILGANQAYRKLIQSDDIDITGRSFVEVVSQHIVESNNLNNVNVQSALQNVLDKEKKSKTDIVQLRRGKSTDTRYCRFEHIPIMGEKGDVEFIVQAVEDVTDELTTKEKETSKMKDVSTREQLYFRNEDLKGQIDKKMQQYEAAKKELNDFIYSVSHDLRAPLRRIDGFSQELINEYLDQLDDMGAHYLKRVRQGAQDMGNLIDALLKLSRISRRTLETEKINLTDLVRSTYADLTEIEANQNVDIRIEEGLATEADFGLTKSVINNLLSNALKFSSKEQQPEIRVGATTIDDEQYFFVKDNGVGFDPEYADKLFKAFDRLHSQKDFKGTGIGLATVKRIINLHGGTIWAKSDVGEGATFYFNFNIKK